MFSALANPHRFMKLTGVLVPVLAVLAPLLVLGGAWWALWKAPAELYQGDTARIMFVHVPAAWLAMGGYVGMAVAGLVWLIWRHSIADVAARSIAPIGAAYTAICLVTGSIWGKPAWGDWWEWDGRMTSVLVLFFLYLGVIALRNALSSRQSAANAAAILALVGAVNIPVIKFSVDWWTTLHQKASVIREEGPAMGWDFLGPLLFNGLAHLFLFALFVLIAMRAEIRDRQTEALRLRMVYD